jgi:hypothetical protein
MTTDLSSWWEGLSAIARIYWIIALPFTIIFIIQLVLTFIGGDLHSDVADGHADSSVGDDSGIHFQFISIKNLIAFFTVFGWSGLGCISSGMGTLAIILISTFSGLIMMLIMASLFFFMARLAYSGNLNISRAVGRNASVYLRIPAKRSSSGKIQISLQGFRTLDALTDDPEEIPTGAMVQVTQVLGEDLLLVKRM